MAGTKGMRSVGVTLTKVYGHEKVVDSEKSELTCKENRFALSTAHLKLENETGRFVILAASL